MRSPPSVTTTNRAQGFGCVGTERDVPGPGKRHRRGNRGVTVHVTMEPGEELAGSIATGDNKQSIAFSGWLGLIEALELVRRRSGLREDPTPQPGSDTTGLGL